MAYLKGLLITLLLASAPCAQDGVKEWVAELQKKADDADVELVRKLSETPTREAATGLVEAYDRMASLYMRREIVRALAKFEGIAEAEQPAFEKLAHVAGNTEDPELREAAIKGLARSATIGKQFLRQIVDSQVPDMVREEALRAHVKAATAADADWYRYLWNPTRERRKDAEGNVEGPELDGIRELAFMGIAPHLSETQLVDALRDDFDPKIRRAALLAMRDRKLPRAAEMAKWLLERVDFPGADRAEAAGILVELEGAAAVPTFLELAKKRDVTQEDLRRSMAGLISKLDDEGVNGTVLKLLGRGKAHEKVFAIRATQHMSDERVLKALRKMLKDREDEVRHAAAISLALRNDKEIVDDLRKWLKGKSPADRRVAIDAISLIERTSTKWLAELAELTADSDRDVRNAALDQLAKTEDPKYLPAILKALDHEDWSTRFVAVDALVRMRHEDTIAPLIARLGKETGRLSKAVGEALWTLTAQPFDEDEARWAAWWEREKANFAIVNPGDLAKAEKERELRRLKARTSAAPKFFGIRIESTRVIFIIDTSGSMTDPVYGRFVGKRAAVRIDVAKQELAQAIENLDPNSLFNIYAFSSGIGHWIKGQISDSSKNSREAALEWVDRLGAGGATNLYDVVKLAFEDPDVDTIFILSDGEPTAGEVIDPHGIREDVAFWNKYRKIKIHTVAIGGNLEVLEWLAQDSGGDYVRIR